MVKLSELHVGTELKYEYGPVERKGITKYAFASGDRNNIHTNDEFAEEMGLKGVIAHGLYSFSMVARCLEEITGDDGQIVKIPIEELALVEEMLTKHDNFKKTANFNQLYKNTNIRDKGAQRLRDEQQ